MQTPETLSEAITLLQQEGYTEDLNVQTNCIECKNLQLKLAPDDFVVDKFYRFEGDTDPDDEEVVYAISSITHNIKGTLVNAFGKDADEMSSEIMKKLAMRK